ncbi:ATP-binding protein [Streptomyces angustmyceticus]|uniref:ATP-binding protein n=1 Tax=Streptomyces angustmyceticus TaxID=285578 RepID=UPI00382257A5
MRQPREKLFSHQPVSVRHARSFVAAALTGWEADGRLDDVNVCVSELATNAIRHGSRVGRGFLVRVASHDERLRVEVRDGGSSEGKAPHVTEPTDDVPDGRGLFLVAAFADDWGVNRHEGSGHTVWAEFKVDTSANREGAAK